MLFKLTSAPRAANVPLFMLGFCVVISVGAVAAITSEPSLWTVSLVVFAVLVDALVLASVRRIWIDGDELVTRSLFGTKRMKIAKLAIGERIRHSQGHKYYDLYAFDGAEEMDLADAMSAKGSARARAKLEALIPRDDWTPTGVEDPAALAKDTVARREAKHAADQAEAQRIVDSYYSSGKFRRAGLIIFAIVLVYSVVMVLIINFRGG